MKHATHLLYGGDAGVAQLLRKRLLQQFPDARIVGAITPPFHELTPHEEQQLIDEVRSVKPDIIWVGLGCPKQEQFMHRHLDRLDTTLMLGVGAAFDVHTGRLHDSPAWVKRAGLQWLHRLLQDPRRLWKRYLRSNSAFLASLALELLGFGHPPLTGDAERPDRKISKRRNRSLRVSRKPGGRLRLGRAILR